MPNSSENTLRASLLRFPTAIRAAGKKLDLRLTLPHESEDAHLTGSTRSLDRRVLALNLRAPRIPVVRPNPLQLETGARIA